MNAPASVFTRVPPCGEWDFGGFRYGLEPLTLPGADTTDGVARFGPEDHARTTTTRIRQLGVRGGIPVRPPSEELYTFRWITGHQASFVLWRLMNTMLDEVARRRSPAWEVVEPLARYLYGYAAMLRYSGSCPPGVYATLIRPGMSQRHPSFSGSWAPDYRPVRDLIRGRLGPFEHVDGAERLADAVDVVQRVHDDVAANLVPDGRSLLRRSRYRGRTRR